MTPADEGPPDQGVHGELREDRHVGGRDLTRWTSPLGQALAGAGHRVTLALGPRAMLLLVLVIGAAIAATMAWLASEIYESVVAANGVALLDQPILRAMLGLRSPWRDAAVTAFTHIGGTLGMPILATVIMVALAVRRRSWTPVILIVGAGAGSLAMTIAGKRLLGRARPPLVDAVPPYEHSASFPSGHTLNAVVIAGVVAYLLVLRQNRRRARVLTVTLAALFAITMGLSRVFLGHHWFTDVLGAWLLGVGWLAVVITAHRLYLTEAHRLRTDQHTEAA